MQYFTLAGVLDRTANVSPIDALVLAALGIAIVFIILILLMCVVALTGAIFDNSKKLKEKHPEWETKIDGMKEAIMFWRRTHEAVEATPSELSTEGAELAKGSCGELTLINTDEREAAMIMAIVADETGTPLNELKFKSIKKIDSEEQK